MKLLSLNCADCGLMSALNKVCLMLTSTIAACFTGSLLLALLEAMSSDNWKIASIVENTMGFGFYSMIGTLPAALIIGYPLLLLGVQVPKSYTDSIAICVLTGGLVGAMILTLMESFQSPFYFPDFAVLSLYSGFGFYFGGFFGFFVKFFNSGKNITN